MKRNCDRCKEKKIYDPYSVYCEDCLTIIETDYEKQKREDGTKS